MHGQKTYLTPASLEHTGSTEMSADAGMRVCDNETSGQGPRRGRREKGSKKAILPQITQMDADKSMIKEDV